MSKKMKKDVVDSSMNNNNGEINDNKNYDLNVVNKEDQVNNEKEDGKNEVKPVEDKEEKAVGENNVEEKIENVLKTDKKNENDSDKAESKGLSKRINKKTKKVIKIIVCSIIAVVLGLFIFRQVQIQLNYNKWLSYLTSAKYQDAYKYYSDGDDELKKSAQKYVTSLSEEAFKKYQKGEITLDEINNDSDIYNKYTIDENDIKATNIVLIDDSRKCFSEGEEYLSKEQYLLALCEYINVDQLDEKDYTDATDRIDKYNDKAYEEAYSIAQAAVSSKDYSAVDYNNWSKIFDDTNVTNLSNLLEASLAADIQSQITNRDLDGARANIERFSLLLSGSEKQSLNAAISNEEEKIRIEGLRDSQEVYVTSTYISKKGYFNSTEIVTIVKSNTSKVTKQIDICVLIFDSNGYPIVSSISFSDSNIVWANQKLNLSQGESGGSNSYLSLYDAGIANVKACVISVEYQDGTEWENPYYSYWIKDNQNRY